MQAHQPFKKAHLEIAPLKAILVVCLGFFMAIAGHVTHLPVWVSLLIVFALLWRSAQAYRYFPIIPRWLIVPFVLAGGIGVFATYWSITGRDAGLALLSVMAAFKLLEMQTHRDALIVVFLSYFVVVTHFLFSQSILIAVYMMLTIVFLTAALISLNEKQDSLSWFERFKLSSSIIGYSIPLMIVLFILVPRVPGPLWGLTSEQRAGVTGLSDHMSPGNISNLIQDNDVAFRVSFKDAIPPQHELYWRGPVLGRFNGQTWFQTTRKSFKKLVLNNVKNPYEYTITMEANGEKWLLPLDIPVQTLPDSTISTDFELKSTKPINDLKKYTLKSSTQVTYGLDEGFDSLMRYTEFPEGVNRKSIEYAQQLRQQFDSDDEIAQQVLKRFRTQPYFYTLNPPLTGKNSVDDFFFNTQKGFCEHYASSFTLIMRAAGIPARVVTGYQGGELNPTGNYLIVRQSDAHAWSEIWLDDKGWVRYDPTAAVSPDRIEKSLDAALSNEQSNFRFQTKNKLISDLLFNWDSIQHQWNNWVLNYNHKKQSDFLKKLGVGIQSTADMVIALVILLTSITSFYAIWSMYKNRPPKPEYFEKLWLQFLNKLSRKGFHKAPAESSQEFANRMKTEATEYADTIQIAAQLYQRIKYSNSANKDNLIKRLEVIYKQLN